MPGNHLIHPITVRKPCDSEKVAIVTGGGSGLGLAITSRFCEHGILTVMIGRDREKLPQAHKMLGKNCIFRLFAITRLEEIPGLVAEIAQTYGATDLSPANMAATLHIGLAINNFGIHEYMHNQEMVHEVFTPNYHYGKDYLFIDDSPGLGVEINEKKAGKYPYKTACLPVNRYTDGTMFNW